MGFRREQEVFRLILKSYFDARRVDFPPIENETRPLKWELDTLDTSSGHTGHLITSETSFEPLPISCCDSSRQIQMCLPVNFAPYWHTQCDTPGSRPLYKLHFVTVCPARNALMVFGLTSPSTIHFVLVHHPSPCPLSLLLPMLPKESGVCKKLPEPALIPDRQRVRSENNRVTGGKVTQRERCWLFCESLARCVVEFFEFWVFNILISSPSLQ